MINIAKSGHKNKNIPNKASGIYLSKDTLILKGKCASDSQTHMYAHMQTGVKKKKLLLFDFFRPFIQINASHGSKT